MSAEQRDRIVYLYSQGVTRVQIIARMDLPASTITRVLSASKLLKVKKREKA